MKDRLASASSEREGDAWSLDSLDKLTSARPREWARRLPPRDVKRRPTRAYLTSDWQLHKATFIFREKGGDPEQNNNYQKKNEIKGRERERQKKTENTIKIYSCM